MSKIIILGASGMLGTSISESLEGHELLTHSSKSLNILCPHKLHETIASYRPDYIINCAAYTAVDLAETDKERAFAINATAVEKLAQIAKQFNATFIHFSTDYVFNGNATAPYVVNHHTVPVNVYGASKLAGEEAIRHLGSKFYIFRVSWLYAPHGKNFFKWVAGSATDTLNVVNTQTGSPTSALDVAAFITYLVSHDPREYGTYHFTNSGKMTWYDFASAINSKMKLGKQVNPITVFETAAQRPTYSVMDCTETEQVFNYKIPTVEEAMDTVIKIYKS